MIYKILRFAILGLFCATTVQAENNDQPSFQQLLEDVHLENNIFE